METLYLLNRYHPAYFDSNGQLERARVSVTRETLPVLQSLTIDHGTGAWRWIEYDAFQLPAATKVPALRHLAVREAPMDNFRGVPAFVEQYGPRLTSLELHCPGDRKAWNDVLNVVGKIRPKMLTIEYKDDYYWACFMDIRILPRRDAGILVSLAPEALSDLAQQVVIRPAGLLAVMEEHLGKHHANAEA